MRSTKITMSELKKIIREEMINEIGSKGEAKPNTRGTEKAKEGKGLSLVQFLGGITIAAALAAMGYKVIDDNKINSAYQNGSRGMISDECAEILRGKIPVSRSTSVAAANCAGAIDNVGKKPVQDSLSRLGVSVSDVKKVEKQIRNKTGSSSLEEQKNKSTKITLSELKSLIYSELNKI
jgi:hypothetical protein